MSVGKGLDNATRMDFRYETRNSECLLTQLGEILVSLSRTIPAGIVVFFPSYAYKEQTVRFLRASKHMADLERVKGRVFEETQTSTDSLLAEYAAAIKGSRKGAVLFSVVGGKLSEGINFADDLGRGVVLVGMPYANRTSVELQEKMQYIDRKHREGGYRLTGNDYYESLCLKRVNQSIGKRDPRELR